MQPGLANKKQNWRNAARASYLARSPASRRKRAAKAKELPYTEHRLASPVPITLVSKLKFHRLVRGLRNAMHVGGLSAPSVIGTVLDLWCRDQFPGLPRSGLPSVVRAQQLPAILSFVEFLRGHELLEATYWLSSAYPKLLGCDAQKRNAMYFTPPSLTAGLLNDLQESGVDFAARRFCDPACGGAAFLVPIAIRMRDALRDRGVPAAKILRHVETHLLGFERDATLCKLSHHFLAMALHREIITCGSRMRAQVIQGDSLAKTAHLHGKLDVVVCNPPFRKMSAHEVAGYKHRFDEIIEGQPNLYALFIALCVRLLGPDGTCALVTPTSFLSGQNFSKLRTFLLDQTTVLHIGMVSDRNGIFIDVEQETALTLVRRQATGHPPETTAEVSVVSRSGAYKSVGRCVLPNTGRAWPIPRTEDDAALLRSAAMANATLEDYGYVPRVGAFVWNRDKRATYPSAKAAARARGRTAVPLLWSSDIGPDGKLRFTGEPKKNREGRFVNLGRTDHRSVIRKSSVILQRVTSNDQPRRLVTAAVPDQLIKAYGGFVGENHTVILEQVSSSPALPPCQLAELLRTPTVDRYFRCISGATNVSVFELNQLLLPDPVRLKECLQDSGDMSRAARMAMRGA